jgi:hypothetical protein
MSQGLFYSISNLQGSGSVPSSRPRLRDQKLPNKQGTQRGTESLRSHRLKVSQFEVGWGSIRLVARSCYSAFNDEQDCFSLFYIYAMGKSRVLSFFLIEEGLSRLTQISPDFFSILFQQLKSPQVNFASELVLRLHRDNVNVKVEYDLGSVSPIVLHYSNGFRACCLANSMSDPLSNPKKVSCFILRDFKNVDAVSLGNDKRVPLVNWTVA